VGAVLAAVLALMSAFNGEWSAAIRPGAKAELHLPQMVDDDGVQDRSPAASCAQNVVRINDSGGRHAGPA